MSVAIITPEDLQVFKVELVRELKELFTSVPSASQSKKWIKSHEVRKMLGISPGTLQSFRDNGTIAFTKVGGLILYDYDDIIKLMEGSKTPAKSQESLFK